MDEVEEFNVIRKGLFDKAGVPYDGLEYVAPTLRFYDRKEQDDLVVFQQEGLAHQDRRSDSRDLEKET